MTKKLLVASLAVVLGWGASWYVHLYARGADLPRKVRSRCHLSPVPWRVSVSARSTPLVGEELRLALVSSAGPKAGRFKTAIDVKGGGLEPVNGALGWIDDLPDGGAVSRDVVVRVTSGLPIQLTARIQPVAAGGVGFPSEQYLTLYPFDRRDGSTRTQWDPRTLRPLGEPSPPLVTFADGDRGLPIKIQ